MALTELDAVLRRRRGRADHGGADAARRRGSPRRVGAVDEPRERGLAERETPLLGGLAILAGVVLGRRRLWLPHDWHAPRSCSAPR